MEEQRQHLFKTNSMNLPMKDHELKLNVPIPHSHFLAHGRVPLLPARRRPEGPPDVPIRTTPRLIPRVLRQRRLITAAHRRYG